MTKKRVGTSRWRRRGKAKQREAREDRGEHALLMPPPSANVRFIPRQAIKGIHKFVGSESQPQQPEKVARRRHEHKSEDANTDSIERSEAANNLTNAPKGEEEDANACQKPYALEMSNAT